MQRLFAPPRASAVVLGSPGFRQPRTGGSATLYRETRKVTRIEKFGTPGAKGPASTMVAVSALARPDYLIELEAMAVI